MVVTWQMQMLDQRYGEQRIDEPTFRCFGLILKAGGNPVHRLVGVVRKITTACFYRWYQSFSPLQEREQKRQYSSAMGPGTLLPWTYYILGPDNAQLGVWHGLQGAVNCDPTDPTDPTDATSVRTWPVEYNSYSVGGRVILRPNGRKEWVVTNHLGSTVAVVEVSTPTAPVVGQQHTTAYGQPITVKGAVDADRARTGYIGRETDAEHNLGAYGARLYSSEYGRFLAVDKLWEEYRSLQPYQYAANSPVMAVDRNGDSIIVLQDWEGASLGAGHSAVLIGGDDVGWKLYSKNGGEYVAFGESKDPQAGGDLESFKTLSDFQMSARDPGQLQGRYDNALLIPTSPEEDKKARAAAEKQVKSDYLLTGASCITVVRDALEAAGKLPVVAKDLSGKPIKGLSSIPNVAFKQIDAMPESKNVDSRVISPHRKDPERKEEKE
jgi:RHS repeat-associated protein